MFLRACSLIAGSASPNRLLANGTLRSNFIIPSLPQDISGEGVNSEESVHDSLPTIASIKPRIEFPRKNGFDSVAVFHLTATRDSTVLFFGNREKNTCWLIWVDNGAGAMCGGGCCALGACETYTATVHCNGCCFTSLGFTEDPANGDCFAACGQDAFGNSWGGIGCISAGTFFLNAPQHKSLCDGQTLSVTICTGSTSGPKLDVTLYHDPVCQGTGGIIQMPN